MQTGSSSIQKQGKVNNRKFDQFYFTQGFKAVRNKKKTHNVLKYKHAYV